MPRFFYPAGFADTASNTDLPEGVVDDALLLDESESHHLSRVMRIAVGENVELFDGQGASTAAEVIEIRKRTVRLRMISPPILRTTSENSVHLAVALPKADRFRWLVEKATELGVAKLTPLETERSVVRGHAGKQEKMEQAVIAACKQCRRNDLMTIESPLSLEQLLAAHQPSQSLLLADLNGSTMQDLSLPTEREPRTTTILIGPEGGFSEAEIMQAQSVGAKLFSLSPNILRTETAAIAAATGVLLLSANSR